MAQPPLSTTTDKRYKWVKHSLRVDDDFEQRYKAAERAYGAGDYQEASRIGGALLNQLETTAEDPAQPRAGAPLWGCCWRMLSSMA